MPVDHRVKGRALKWVPLSAMAAVLWLAPFSAGHARQEASAQELKDANNPLANMKAVNLQNYYIPNLYGLPDQSANTFWIRGAGGFGRWFARASLPISTVPTTTASDPVSGLGDFNAFATYTWRNSDVTAGIGPLLVIPTATNDALGAGKWQLGAAGIVYLSKSPTVQGGALLSYQHSFAGDSDRETTSLLVAQPFWFWQLGGGTYLRTAPVWSFDLANGNYAIPFGFGIGQVIATPAIVFNIFLEPQFTVLHSGVGQPALQLFVGFNNQLVGL